MKGNLTGLSANLNAEILLDLFSMLIVCIIFHQTQIVKLSTGNVIELIMCM